MPSYHAPLRDLHFVYHELLDADDVLTALPGFEEATPDLVDAILEEAAKLFEQEIQPLNQPGDEEGCRFEDGRVHTPKGFREAYRAYTEGGWPALSLDPAIGGQGLPETIAFMLEEMINSASVSFGLYPGLTRGAVTALQHHASDELKAIYLPKMAAGTWSGTMCLTEPHAGTDLGLLRTRAEPRGDGSYRIDGTKIFITGGEQDLTENIVHLVLARLPDAPPGIRGISLFLVPKRLPDANGEAGEANGVSCGAIEHKMGIRASSTCVINFDDATGFLVGPEHRGVACMFTMMNAERLAIGIQGLGLAEVAYQNAVGYARERRQGRSARGPQDPDHSADPLLVHPDVRRMLLTTRAFTEGGRALAVWTALNIDLSKHHPDPELRQEADDLVALVTPVVKALFSDLGFESTVLCQQVLGGHGYIREWGMEQFVRDARIAQIYEGTNGIQALDLVRRKLFLHDGRLPNRLFDLIEAYMEPRRGDASLQPFLTPLEHALTLLRELTAWLIREGSEDPDELGAAATDYLRIFGLVILAWFWVRMVETALEDHEGRDDAFYRAKILTGHYFLQRILPQIGSLAAAVRSGARLLMEFEEEAF
ncbi:MAG TPA: acyl-CoA dehydrogenase [Sedimenticola thiotaurini]|uniref:3-methylmercaptopropionyl-CoA dehydrogenase n=1 Tax=Sedimenticola thiotaurini TaxID=1543721 RepID=A0A831W7G9_9GAMM|nr:acyl-CoA dehydrogenase [Sedimenticola thiotaurini]